MKTLRNIVIALALLVPFHLAAQNAPGTIAPQVLHPGPTLTVPITVTQFNDIGAISLTLAWDPAIVHVTGVAPNASLPGFQADWTTIPGRIVMGWYGSSGITLPDYSVLVEITFNGLVAGETDLTWTDDGGSCEYAAYDGGNYTVLNDAPTGDFYHNGHIAWQRPGPSTVAPIFCSEPGQDICIPVLVNQFMNVGSISLTMDYDPGVLTYQSISPASIPGSWTFSGLAQNPGRLVVGGYGPAISSLPDGSVLYYACFHYNGGTTQLTWYDDDQVSCEYADGTTLIPLADRPMTAYYINGQVGPPVLHADFSADNTMPDVGATVTFTDLSTGSPAGWTWTFDKPVVFMNGTTFESQHPQVQFTEHCLQTVTLTVTRGNTYCDDAEIKTGYIRVGTPGLWTGLVSTDWHTPENWDNCQVPDASTDVTIPATAPNWPYYEGNFTMGVQCKTITLSDITSQIIITGDLVQ